MRIYISVRLLLLFATAFFFTQSPAQQISNNIIKSKKTPDGRFNFLQFDNAKQLKNAASSDAPANVKSILGLGAKHSLVADARFQKDISPAKEAGSSFTRYHQFYNGIKVEYATVTVQSVNGSLSAIAGEYFAVDDNFSTAPALSATAAFASAVAFMGAKKYSWEDSSFKNENVKGKPKGELVICKDFTEKESASAGPKMRLAYKFAIYATNPLRYDNIYVDAATGKIIHSDPIIKHTNGTADTKYSGSRTITTTQNAGGKYILRDSTGNYNLSTYNMNRGSSYTTATDFADNDNSWTAAEYNNTNYDNAALDAHWGTMMTLDYWKTVHNRSGFDNNGTKLKSYVHYGNAYSNAYWDGYEMTYGDGDGSHYLPFTSVDIVGHEIGHGVCQNTANLIYSGESGAMNEGFSDIWGACIKRFAAPEKNTWLCGDEISPAGIPIRSVSNPKSRSCPDTYKGTYWYTGTNDGGGVHTNSGVLTHWFYILTEGKTGSNDNGFSYSVSGIGITKAAKIAFRAESVYLFPSATYLDARILTIQSAQDLYGANSNEVIQTTKAWDAVGVYDALAKPDALTGTLNANNISLAWHFNNIQPIDGFVIERAVNEGQIFVQIATADSGARSFTDTGFSRNSINKYRIRSYKGTVYSDYSSVALVVAGSATYVMQNGNISACGITFLDPGGTGLYSNLSSVVTTISPAIAGNKVRVIFSKFRTELYSDYLYVYNGPNTSYPYLGSFSGSTLPPVLESSAPNGELTFAFSSGSANVDSGWQAYVSCFLPVTAPTNLTASLDSAKRVNLSWRDNANDETKYVVERSVNDLQHFTTLVNLGSNTTVYTDSAAPDNSFAYYRVRAFRDTTGSVYSSIASIKIGNAPYIMQSGTFFTCSNVFLDPGGTGAYSNSSYVVSTIYPAIAGNKVKVAFTKFRTELNGDYLYVYNGPSTSYPLLGSFSGTTLPPDLLSTAANGELTFSFSSNSTVADSGWEAYLSCYRPVAAPTNLTAAADSIKRVNLRWTDNATDETKYVVERSVGDAQHFAVLINLDRNATAYTDNTAGDNSFVYYRVKAYRDTIGSQYSAVANVLLGSATYVMQNTNVSACGFTFLDPGGTDVYSNSGNTATTFSPATPGTKVRVAFSKFRTEYNDYLYIYNGPSSSSPIIGIYAGTGVPPLIQSSAANGELTFVFYTNSSVVDSGWQAFVSCYKPVAAPSNFTASADSLKRVNLRWIDNADDETRYAVERSVTDSFHYLPVVNLAPNTTAYTDSAAPDNSYLYYRVRAFRNADSSFYTASLKVKVGDAPYIMQYGIFSTCGSRFTDPGGADVYGNYSSVSTTISPATAGNKIRVAFSKFRTEATNDYLQVFDGPGSYSPVLGTYSGTTLPPVLQSTASGGELTFVFYSNYNITDSGWEAYLSCVKPVAAPTNLTATVDTLKRVRLQWSDNAADETGYAIERSLNDALHFTPIATTSGNGITYTDSNVPNNTFAYYRVKAYRDTVPSVYSSTAIARIGDPPFIMQNGTFTTCGSTFLDPGGFDNYYNNSGYITATVAPGITGNKVRCVFSKFRTESYYDYLQVYNGPNSSYPSLGSYSGSSLPPAFQSTAANGELTFVFYSNAAVTDSGWQAYLSCIKPVAAPSSFAASIDTFSRVNLRWTDNANDETRYTVERSTNDSLHFSPVVNLAANTTTYTDSTPPANSYVYYRVIAFKDTLASNYSPAVIVKVGDAPYIMQNGTFTTCGTVFLDPGGAGNYSNSGYTVTTFSSAVTGNKIRVAFSKFKTESGNDYLQVYDGPYTYSPSLGTYSGTSIPAVFESSATNGELTFVFSTNSTVIDSGWQAYISCFKPVNAPTGLTVSTDNFKRVRLQWTDNANDETKYVVERQVNNGSFAALMNLPSNTTTYTDSAAPDNSLVYYRVRAFRDTLPSKYSAAVNVRIGNGAIAMQPGAFSTCGVTFLDPGGYGPYSGSYYSTTTFAPSVTGNKIKVAFSKFRMGSNNDYLYIYDGPTQYYPLLGYYTGTTLPPVLSSSAANGELTFLFSTSYSSTDSGWEAYVSCFKPVTAPSNLTLNADTVSKRISLSWTDNATDETSYSVERSQNDSLHFVPLVNLAANTTSYTDSAPPANSIIYYRVNAVRDTVLSKYSNTVSIIFGNAFTIMRNGTVTTCSTLFLDPGGFGNYSDYSSYTTTFVPGESGKKLRVSFSQFSTESCCDYLAIYNGPNTSSPLFGSYRGYTIPPVWESTAANGELTFVFYSDGSANSAGWQATISCFKPLTAPSGLTVSVDTSRRANLTWRDNAPDETGYVVERSVNAVSKYVPIALLPANASSFTDSTTPNNSILYYKVKAVRDVQGSAYSDSVKVLTGNAPFLMKDSILITCDKVFMDQGGEDVISPTYITYTATFKPSVVGNRVRVMFSKFRINNYSYLYVYNGPSVNSPLIGTYSGTAIPSTFDGTGVDGSLTFRYSSTGYADSGWVAQVSCYKPVAKPTALTATPDNAGKVQLSWRDNADDENRYVVERSVNAPSLYKPLVQLAPNTTSYTDSAAPDNSLLFYRIRAYRDTLGSFYSDTAKVAIGNSPFLMKDSILITCDKVFMDPGGEDVTPANYLSYTTTFKPSVAGNRTRVVFSKMRLNGYFYVYNGPSTNSPVIGSYSGTTLPPVFDGNGPDGSLTIRYNNNGYSDSGWVAQVSCYKPVAKPTGLTATPDNAGKVQLSWRDNADDENRYVVERSVNAPSLYRPLAQLPANTTSFTDSTSPNNSLLFYRVRAYRDTLGSFYSDTAKAEIGNAPFLMMDSTVITCNKVFMDPGGEDATLRTYLSYTTTFKPSVPGNRTRIVFSKMNLNGSYINVYNGPSVNSPSIGTYAGTTFPPVDGTGTDGSLTLRYYNNGYLDSGWVAQVSCYKPVAKPTGLTAIVNNTGKVQLGWRDNADDETKYVVERSVNAPSKYVFLSQLPANATSFTDSTTPDNSLLFYRVRAIRDSTESFYSDTAKVAVNNAPFIMSDSTVITCNKVFLDPGGIDATPASSYTNTAVFKPSVAGNRIRVQFSSFNINGYLYVYNGSSINSPLIGSYYGTALPPVFEGTGIEGSLTFRYYNYYSVDPGWQALVTCYQPVAKPSGMTAIPDTGRNVRLSWRDNANDETKYVVERSANAPSKYQFLAQLPANATSFTDTTVPNNSQLYYRVKAVRDTTSSPYSDTAKISINNAPFLMKDSTVITCNTVFMDNGGEDVGIYNTTSTTTFKPSVAGNRIRVTFSKFNTYSYLYVYNGPSTSSSVIGNYYGTSLPPVLEGTGTDGSLTFRYSNYSTNDSGWLAQVICYKPVTPPSNLTALADNNKRILLRWTDNSADETKFVIERSQNDTFHFAAFKELLPNTTQYTDSTAPDNSTVYYRVAAYRDNIASPYTNIANVTLGDAPLSMTNGTFVTCDRVFLDPGGAGNYPNSSSYTTTFTPATAGNKLRVTFSQFSTEGCCDNLRIYNGPTTSSPLLGSYAGATLPPVLQSTAANGELTFVFSTDGSVTDIGWVSRISCVSQFQTAPVLTASLLRNKTVSLQWTDPNNNETGIVVERSFGDTVHFKTLVQLPANSVAFLDSSAFSNTIIYYRVKTFNFTVNSAYSNLVNVTMTSCSAPAMLADRTTSTRVLVSANTTITDDSCKLIAEVQPQGLSAASGGFSAAVKVENNVTSGYGITFASRHFDILPDSNYYNGTGLVRLYFTQAEFDNYNNSSRFAKLPANANDVNAIRNIRMFVCRGTSNDGSSAVNSYYSLPSEVPASNIQTVWNNTYNCWEVRANITGFGGLFLSSATDTITASCSEQQDPVSAVKLKSNIYGDTYRWQKYNGISYVNIYDDANNAGTQTYLLETKISTISGIEKFRCVVDGNNSAPVVVIKGNKWMGTISTDWNNAANWSCGYVPAAGADVIVEGGKNHYPILQGNVILGSMKVYSGATVEVAPGYTLTILH